MPDFSESEEFGFELKDNDVREINYRLLDIACYQHFLRRFKHYRYGFGGPLTFLIHIGFFAMFMAIFFQGFEFSLPITLMLGLLSLIPVYTVIKVFRLRKFHKFQKLFSSKLSLSYATGDLKGTISITNNMEEYNKTSDYSDHKAKVIGYDDYDENEKITCPICGWSGLIKDASKEYYDDLFDVSCKKCQKMLLVVPDSKTEN